MDLQRWEEHFPEIQKRIDDLQPDALVCGLGPSAYFLPRLRLPERIRLWGCHDFFRIQPCHELVIMDIPQGNLHPATFRYEKVVKATPERFWIYGPNHHHWMTRLPEGIQQRPFSLKLMHPMMGEWQGLSLSAKDPYHHTLMSPTGMTCMAWGEGARRIGVIGVDLLAGHHHLHNEKWVFQWFYGEVRRQAREAGGEIVNLSPFSTIKTFHPNTQVMACRFPGFSSAPTAASKEPALKQS